LVWGELYCFGENWEVWKTQEIIQTVVKPIPPFSYKYYFHLLTGSANEIARLR